MAEGTLTSQVKFMICPSCKNAILGRATFEVTLDPWGFKDADEVTANGKMVGISMRHECRDGKPVTYRRGEV